MQFYVYLLSQVVMTFPFGPAAMLVIGEPPTLSSPDRRMCFRSPDGRSQTLMAPSSEPEHRKIELERVEQEGRI